MDKDNNRYTNDKSKDIPGDGSKNKGWEQYSDDIGNNIAGYEDEDAFIDEVNSSLAQQISTELEDKDTSTNDNNKKKKGKVPKGVKIFGIIFSAIMLIGCLLVFTPGGRSLIIKLAGNYIYGKLDYEDSNTTDITDNDQNTVENHKPDRPVEHIVNILLLGVEEIGGASNTDLMIVATMNTKDNTMKLTSIMRDMYVEIPGHDNNKLNSAYARGGIDLLYQTIENNFGVHLDGYVLVNFDSFEKLVDLVGGVDVTLTNTEANYLNTTNYISDPANRHVKAGTQLMNGNQALGYCRVRKVSTGTENNDFGRTQRQRAVLNSIFDKLKSKNVLQLGLFMNDVLNNVNIKTDITQSEFNEYLEEAASLNVKKLENLRIPSDGNYKTERVQIGKYKQDVLLPTDWDAMRGEIHEFIYGADSTSTTDVNSADDTTDTQE